MKYYCGIDQGKQKSDLCVLDEHGKIVARLSTPNKLELILAFLKRFGKKDTHIVVESSSICYWLLDGLQDNGYDKLTQAHALLLKMITHAKVKTDRHDAHKLAMLLRAGCIPEAYIYPRALRWLRDLARSRMELVEQRAMEFTRLRMLATRYGKEDLRRKDIPDLDTEDIKHLLDDPYLAIVAPGAVERMELLSKQIIAMDADLEQHLSGEPLLKALRRLPGIGTTLSLTLFLESGELQRFATVKHFCSYCRVAPGIAQSGSKTGVSRGAKQGNAHLKRAFMMAATAAVRSYPHIKDYFEHHLAKRHSQGGKIICYNIIAHKLAQAVYLTLMGTRVDLDRLFDVTLLQGYKAAG